MRGRTVKGLIAVSAALAAQSPSTAMPDKVGAICVSRIYDYLTQPVTAFAIDFHQTELISDGEYATARRRLFDAARENGVRVETPSYKYQREENDQVGLCRAGEETFEIDGDGRVYPCSFSFGRFCAGDVRDGNFQEIFFNLQRHSINNDWCFQCKGRGGKGEKVVGFVPQLIERFG